jgi:hypothetical protein
MYDLDLKADGAKSLTGIRMMALGAKMRIIDAMVAI